MFALLLCGLIAGACAYPQLNTEAPKALEPSEFVANIDLTHANENALKPGLLADLNKDLNKLNDILARIRPSDVRSGVVGKEYEIVISLPEFEEKDITVKSREGFVEIKANHKSGRVEENYSDVKKIPHNVVLPGNWEFKNEVLKITFQLKDEATTAVPVTTESKASQ